MTTLVTGTPGCGKTTLVEYAQKQGKTNFFDADFIPDLCEWRDMKTGQSIGLAADIPSADKDNWYKRYGWYWQASVLRDFLSEHPDAVICGSAENVTEFYKVFDKLAIIIVTKEELEQNLNSPNRKNPFGQTAEQRAGFMEWQDFLLAGAKGHQATIISGNVIEKTFQQVAGLCKND